MNLFKIIFCSVSFLMTLNSYANSIRVNNMDPTADAQNLDDAYALANEGDTLYIEGSSQNYGSLDIQKRLVLIGPGYFLSENSQTVSMEAELNRIELLRPNFNDGPFTGAAGTVIMGLKFSNLGNAIEVRVSNVCIQKCKMIGYIWIPVDDVSNTLIKQNFFEDHPFYTGPSDPFTNMTYANNISSGEFGFPDNSSGAVEHNTFLDPDGRFELVNFAGTVKSNILASIQTANFNMLVSSNLVEYNTGGNNQFGSTNNNNSVPPANLFVGGNSPDGQYMVASPNVMDNAHDGTDRGAFGGSLPYCLSGVGGIPLIYFLCAPIQGTFGSPFPIQIKASSGN